MDEVFKAIHDPSRRLLLDALYERDGQTLSELSALLPEMTRFGVMSHLGVLEEAGLVTTRRQGRSKFHYLNPVPIRLIHDRWISRYAEPRVGAIAGIKARVETGEHKVEKPAHVYSVFIRGTAEEVWDAMVNPEKTQQYYYGTRVHSDWEVGSPRTYSYPDGTLAATGVIISIDPPKRLEATFHPLWDEALEAEGPVREVWTLSEDAGMVELTVEYHDIGDATLAEFAGGLAFIVSWLKSLVETGAPLSKPS